MDLGISSERVPGGWLVEVSGEVDLHTAPRLRAALDDAVAAVTPPAQAPAGRAGAVLVDLAGVSFMDSTGLGELMAAHKALDRAGGRLHLVVAAGRVARVLSLTGLDEVLAIHPDPTAALAALAGDDGATG